MDWLDLLAVKGTLKSLLQHHSSKASILPCYGFFIVQLSHPYMTTGKTIALRFVGKVMSLLFNMLSRLVIAFLPRSKCLLISWQQSQLAICFTALFPHPTPSMSWQLFLFLAHWTELLASVLPNAYLQLEFKLHLLQKTCPEYTCPPQILNRRYSSVIYSSLNIVWFFQMAHELMGSKICGWNIFLFY